jgi:tetratricopeptide (TPR) repeat protein
LQQAALLAPLASRSRHEMAAGLKQRGYQREAEQQWQLILRTGPFREWYVNDAAKNLGNAATEMDRGAAARGWETVLLSCLRTKSAFVDHQGYLQIPYLIHKARARSLLASGDHQAAEREIALAMRFWPGNVSLAEDLVPELEANGCHEAATTLFDTSFAAIQEICDNFPRSGLHHNNLAWLAARCNRQLEEALKHAFRAVQLVPDNPSYLDTLGEVYFQLGNFEQAVHCAEQCLAVDPSRAHFQQQLERFQAALSGSP